MKPPFGGKYTDGSEWAGSAFLIIGKVLNVILKYIYQNNQKKERIKWLFENHLQFGKAT
jgi:hypothetical protein